LAGLDYTQQNIPVATVHEHSENERPPRPIYRLTPASAYIQ
jgi:hypothetical protein